MKFSATQSSQLAELCLAMESKLPTEGDVTARDWSGFFAALAAFAKALLPIILPLVLEPKQE